MQIQQMRLGLKHKNVNCRVKIDVVREKNTWTKLSWYDKVKVEHINRCKSIARSTIMDHGPTF